MVRIIEYSVISEFVFELNEISVSLYIDSGCGVYFMYNFVVLVVFGFVVIISDADC